MSKLKIAALVLTGLVAAFAAYGVWVWRTLPDVSYLSRQNPKETALMRERGGKVVQQWVPLGQISEHLVQAVLAAEDSNFYGHHGFDLDELRKAVEEYWEEGRALRGASTITQQLAKNLFLSTERSYLRKLNEALLTRRLEQSLSKKRILEIYLNVIEWGDGVYGAEAAARDVLGKSAGELDAAEGALLAAMIPNPRRLDPCARPKSVKVRQERILGYMYRAKRLTEEEYEQAKAAPIELRKCGLFGSAER